MNYKIRDFLNKNKIFEKILGRIKFAPTLSHHDALCANTVFGFDAEHEDSVAEL